jgi:hypothetical protein
MGGRARFRRSDDVVKKAAGRCRSENAMCKVTGGCLCGAVRYELNSAPKLSVSCHCRDCQYVSGGAPAHALIMRAEDVTITQGQVKEYWTLSAKGNRVARIFCEVCGTPLFAKNEKHPEFLPVKVGGLDDPSQFRTQANIWTQSAPPWHCLDSAVPRFKEDPEIGLTALFELTRTSIVRLGRAVGFFACGGKDRARGKTA